MKDVICVSRKRRDTFIDVSSLALQEYHDKCIVSFSVLCFSSNVQRV